MLFSRFWFFVVDYFTTYQEYVSDPVSSTASSTNATFYGLGDAIRFANGLPHENLYMSELTSQSYIFYLWYSGMGPHEFLEKRVIPHRKVMFHKVEAIGNVYFEMPKKFSKKDVYIIETWALKEAQESGSKDYQTKGFGIEEFGNYSVVYAN